MPNTKIGIMLANRDFYPVLEEDVPSRKRLVVTTVNDNQTNIQINLYRENKAISSKAEYLDTLLIEDIVPKKKGEPSIALVVGIDDKKNLYAKATDKDTGNTQSLKVSLAKAGTIISETSFELPEFDATSFPQHDVDDDPLRDNVLISDSEAEGTLLNNLYDSDDSGSGTHKGLGLAVLLIILFILIALGVAAFILKPPFLTALFNKEPDGRAAVEAPQESEVQKVPEPVEEPEEVAFVEVPEEPAPAPVEETAEPAAEVAEQPKKPDPVVPKKPAPAKTAKAVRYKIKWGDTLWDICDTYYKNPWRYKYLARWNGIKNPDHIISGRYLEIPPQ